MLSLGSLAFNLCSAMRRARALSYAAFHRFPDIRKRRKTATNNAKKMATVAPMSSLLRIVYASKAITARGAKDPLRNVILSTWPSNAQTAEVTPKAGR
jgi:hypothetical protein